ncbi:unnamed protein product [Rotaria magnacalcarata]|uniref:Uncharacterized protein n=2 Tax=Rotaria magnacalcarata TaxID=392030 RepID=A0A8S2SZM4_9BILA|nr:unnamed protein product [Rotaria magnacalcarata]
MKYVVLFLLFGVTLSNLSSEWDKFKRDYNKHYASTAEENERQQIFFENVNRIRSYQQTHSGATFAVEINHLTDRRIEELVSGSKIHFEPRPISLKSSNEVKNLPESLDWREKGVITPVIEQGELAVIQGPLVATEVKLGGICRKSDYPEIVNKCEPNACNPFTTFDEIKKLKEKDENTMLTWIQVSTLWVVMNAIGKGFGDYKGGIYDEPTCPKTDGNHAMQVVGYGVEGEQWGEKGYIRMKRVPPFHTLRHSSTFFQWFNSAIVRSSPNFLHSSKSNLSSSLISNSLPTLLTSVGDGRRSKV